MGQKHGPKASQSDQEDWAVYEIPDSSENQESIPDSIQALEEELARKETEQSDTGDAAEEVDAVSSDETSADEAETVKKAEGEAEAGDTAEIDESAEEAVESEKEAKADEAEPMSETAETAEVGEAAEAAEVGEMAEVGETAEPASEVTAGSVLAGEAVAEATEFSEEAAEAGEAETSETVESAETAEAAEVGETAETAAGEAADGEAAESGEESADSDEPVRKGLARLSMLPLTLILVVECLCAVLIAVYVGIGVYFSDHFFFNTTLNGMDVSQMTADEVLQMEKEGIDAYELTIECRDGTAYTISAEDFSLQELWNGAIENLVEQQNALTWIASLRKETEYTLEGTIVYDVDELKECLNELDFMKEENQVAAVDACISEYDALTGYSVVPSAEGTQINEDVLYAVLDEAFLALNGTVNLVDSGCYLEPNVREDDETLNATVASLNSYVVTTINYEIGDITQTLDGSTIKDWLIIADDGSVSLDKSAVSEYVSELASTYNTCYSNKTLATSYGSTVTITNIHYGWKVDQDAEYSQLLEEIEAGETVTRDLNYSMTANSHTGNDYGNSYVEINLTAQHVFVYKDGELVIDTDCVSGLASSADRATPTGAFTVTYKQKDATLTGADYSSDVSYWMPFYGGYGLHDATWRSSFGGTIYKTNGSHGCVNLPLSAAKVIYETIDKGWPVLIYTLEGTENYSSVKAAAEEVEDKINAISSTVTLEDESAITAARSAYDALSSTAKSYVSNYSTLTAAEDALKALQEASEWEIE